MCFPGAKFKIHFYKTVYSNTNFCLIIQMKAISKNSFEKLKRKFKKPMPSLSCCWMKYSFCGRLRQKKAHQDENTFQPVRVFLTPYFYCRAYFIASLQILNMIRPSVGAAPDPHK